MKLVEKVIAVGILNPKGAVARGTRGVPYATETDDGTPQDLVMDHDKPAAEGQQRRMDDPPDLEVVFEHEYPFGDDIPMGIRPHEFAKPTHDLTPAAEKLNYWQRSTGFGKVIQLDAGGAGNVSLIDSQSTAFYLVERVAVFFQSGAAGGRLECHIGQAFNGFGFQGGIPNLALTNFVQWNPPLFLDDNQALYAVIAGGPANGIVIVTAQALVVAR